MDFQLPGLMTPEGVNSMVENHGKSLVEEVVQASASKSSNFCEAFGGSNRSHQESSGKQTFKRKGIGIYIYIYIKTFTYFSIGTDIYLSLSLYIYIYRTKIRIITYLYCV